MLAGRLWKAWRLPVPLIRRQEPMNLEKQLFQKSEKSLQRSVRAFLKKQPGWWIKASDRFVAGIPDILGCLNGYFVAIELKRPGSKGPTDLQAHNMRLIQDNGGIAIWVTSLEEVKQGIKIWLQRAKSQNSLGSLGQRKVAALNPERSRTYGK
jgi:hypothetical protein